MVLVGLANDQIAQSGLSSLSVIYYSAQLFSCPRCHSKMVRRMSDGNYFYGCSAYPICKGTRNL
ncbi:topoisomerase DNA-binding C4 zinc finger domain-containing protein [Enterobacter hormaechei]|uniref:topoisomerase DNA-binding C4 zinc finger domain-containing protein n=1 Tax=Enterobacter hormaechei TaxID=158836 RepID=UPI003526370C